jgi:hypothetical protein
MVTNKNFVVFYVNKRKMSYLFLVNPYISKEEQEKKNLSFFIYFFLHHSSAIYKRHIFNWLCVSVIVSCDIRLSRFALQNIQRIRNVEQVYSFHCRPCGCHVCITNKRWWSVFMLLLWWCRLCSNIRRHRKSLIVWRPILSSCLQSRLSTLM